MDTGGGCCGPVVATEACRCPVGAWPACGVAQRCGYWEAEARRQGIAVVAVEGLTLTEVVTVAGCDPVILLSAWRAGPAREEAVCKGLCELHRLVRGVEDARRQIRRSVMVLREAC